MRATAAALLGLALTACAPAVRQAPLLAPASAEHAIAAASEEASSVAGRASDEAPPAQEARGEPREALATDMSPGSGVFDPEVVHRARIAMARAALVEDNLNKARVDLAEELARELAALQDGETSKSRVKHGKAHKKQP